VREIEDWQCKLDHRLIRLLDTHLSQCADAAAAVSVLLRFEGAADALRNLPCEVGTIAGDVATARVRLKDVPTLARAATIVFLELAG
jgi:hypothetical protein